MPRFKLIVLDTSVVSEFSKLKPKEAFLEFLDEYASHHLAIPFPVLVELTTGIEKKMAEQPLRARQLRRWLNLLMATDIQFLPADERVCSIYSKMLVMPQLRNFWIVCPGSNKKPGMDLMIAATAIAYGCPVATSNVKDFIEIHDYFPLQGIFNPSNGEWAVLPSLLGPPDKLLHQPMHSA
ncbi:PIN domain-containing protein [Phyllobacterium sophorae]|uniref:PIN domain-containing protein n=1 Tax=Phyllobacterium sophorae TaxID=1520277 RepID=A0A2P7BFV3_9HYPH|nr:PIN domain-containing protein [Phyllobacterium sophorae]PSH65302.1 hypothetical protein CU103_09885 [Phyllobacterium sophorae]